MCLLNFAPWDSDEPVYPLVRGRPRVAWIVPVSMSKLGASLQAIVDTMPQTTTLRLCHRFRDGPLSRLPQELLEHIIDDAQRAARKDCQSGWYQDAVCWQGTCLPEDHYNFYGEEVERLWQEIFVNQQHTWIDQATLKDKTEAEKSKMVSNWVSDDPKYHHSEGTFSLHLDARFRWLDRTCLCPERYSDARKKVGSFVTLNKALKSQFGLEAIILHEKLSDTMYDFLPNSYDPEEHAYYTVCYLALPDSQPDSNMADGTAIATQYESGAVHTSFRQPLESSKLSISEKQRFRFSRAMKRLMLKPQYHLSELEPHVVHPITDDLLADICSCREMDCPGECPDIHSWDRPSCLEQILKRKSKELAKESWPKLYNLAPSDTVTPYDMDE